MLRKVINILAFCVICMNLSAGENDNLLQKTLTSTLNAKFQLYEAGMDGVVAKGTITTYGGRYVLHIAGGYTIYNDGANKYTVNVADKEVIVERMTAADDIATVLNDGNHRVDGDALLFTWRDGKKYRLVLKEIEFSPSTDTSVYMPGEFSDDYIITDLRDE